MLIEPACRVLVRGCFGAGPRAVALGCLAASCGSGADVTLTVPLAEESPVGQSPSRNDLDPVLSAGLPPASNAPECGPLLLTTRGSAHLARNPYLQDVTPTEARVLFSTHEPDDAVLLTLTAAAGTRTISTERDVSDPSGHQRLARLSGLEPGTRYCYQLTGWTEPVRFQTAPLPGDLAPVRFVAFGDSGGDNRDAVERELALTSFDLLLHVGDITYPSSTLANLETKFFATYAGVLSSVPIFPASGNHEYMADGAAPYRQVFALPANGGPDGNERWYSFDWGSVHFVALDTERVGAAQALWLDRDLGGNQLPWTIVYLHRPPFSSGTHGGNRNVRDAFGPVFEKYAVPLVLAGHDHDYERTYPIEGVTYIVTGGGGFSVRPVGVSDFTALSASVFHFVRAEVGPSAILLEAIDTSGALIDSVTIARPDPTVP